MRSRSQYILSRVRGALNVSDLENLWTHKTFDIARLTDIHTSDQDIATLKRLRIAEYMIVYGTENFSEGCGVVNLFENLINRGCTEKGILVEGGF